MRQRVFFYDAALSYGSEEFARSLEQPYVPFVNRERYLKEAQRILAQERYETLCSASDDYRHALEEAIALAEGRRGKGGGGGG